MCSLASLETRVIPPWRHIPTVVPAALPVYIVLVCSTFRSFLKKCVNDSRWSSSCVCSDPRFFVVSVDVYQALTFADFSDKLQSTKSLLFLVVVVVFNFLAPWDWLPEWLPATCWRVLWCLQVLADCDWLSASAETRCRRKSDATSFSEPLPGWKNNKKYFSIENKK